MVGLGVFENLGVGFTGAWAIMYCVAGKAKRACATECADEDVFGVVSGLAAQAPYHAPAAGPSWWERDGRRLATLKNAGEVSAGGHLSLDVVSVGGTGDIC